jgi:hypothetical protein
MKSVENDQGECLRKWHRTRRANLLLLSGEVPPTLCMDEVSLIICCRYVESLMSNPRVVRYLRKYHPNELLDLQQVLIDLGKICGIATPSVGGDCVGGGDDPARITSAQNYSATTP